MRNGIGRYAGFGNPVAGSTGDPVVSWRTPSPVNVYDPSAAVVVVASRALLSDRVIKLCGTNLRWLDRTNVLRVELPKEALPAIQSDPALRAAADAYAQTQSHLRQRL